MADITKHLRPATDVVIDDMGTIWSLRLLTKAAQDWGRQNVEDAWPNTRRCLMGDWRPMREIARAMEAEGFSVQRGNTSPLAWR